MKDDSAFTGLEAAIVLIAFVVVAAVFSYVMLGAGFFATQKAQEVTYSGIKQTTSNVVLDGQLYGSYTTATGLGELTFYIRVPEGGESVKVTDISFLYGKNNAVSTAIASASIFCGASQCASTNFITPGGRQEITLKSLAGPKAGSKFALEIKPSIGASTLIQRTLASGYAGGVII